jgi:hypothetical protein
MDKKVKATLVAVKSIINHPSLYTPHHTVNWDGKHYVFLSYYQCGKWNVKVVALKTGEVKNSAMLNPNQVIGWVYGTICRIQYLKYNKHSMLAR